MASAQPYQLTARTLALSDVIPTQAADGATEVGKNTIQDVADLVTAGEVVTVKVSLTSADILALAATPITLIPAQGAGTFIKLIGVTMKLNYVSTTYTGGALRIYFSSGGSFIITNNTYTNSSSVIFTPAFSTTQVFTTGAENDDLIIDAASAVTVGDGSLDIYLTYSVISL